MLCAVLLLCCVVVVVLCCCCVVVVVVVVVLCVCGGCVQGLSAGPPSGGDTRLRPIRLRPTGPFFDSGQQKSL